VSGDRRFYEAQADSGRRSAPAALRNREPIGDVLADWLPRNGLVLEVASGTGEHGVYFAGRFPGLEWQPSDLHADALDSIRSWKAHSNVPNLLDPLVIDAGSADWPIERADALVNINMVHISPWRCALGLLDGAARLLPAGGPLILYGPWLSDRIETSPTNLAFDADLRSRDPEWGLRKVEDFAPEAEGRGLYLAEQRSMPANNLMLLFRNGTAATAA
jgi:hypothetical protein